MHMSIQSEMTQNLILTMSCTLALLEPNRHQNRLSVSDEDKAKHFYFHMRQGEPMLENTRQGKAHNLMFNDKITKNTISVHGKLTYNYV